MIKLEELQQQARDRLKEAKVLYENGCIHWSVYTCGYGIETALKKKICETLRWLGYPSSEADFRQFKSFKTHDLNVLLHLSGVEDQIKEELFTEWSIIASSWNPEMRYSSEKQTEQNAKLVLEAAEMLLNKL